MEKYANQIDALEDEMVTLWKNWSNINSGTDNLEGLKLMLRALLEAFSKLGNVQEVELPMRKRINSKGILEETPLGNALIVTKHEKAPVQILLAGHMDIALSLHIPFPGCKEIKTNILSGPGVADMKGGLVILFYALKMLEESPYAGNVGWTVIINPDEEIGSPGSKELFAKHALGKKFGLIFEPAMKDGCVVSARKGSANFTAIARGKTAHAGRDLHLGKNAVTLAAKFALAAEALGGVNIGQIEGGGPVNIVPDLSLCRLNVRTNALEVTKENLLKIANQLNIELIQDTFRPVKPFDEATEKLFHRVAKHAKRFGFELNWKETGGVCDGNLLAAAGLPTIDTLGVIGSDLHTLEEYAEINTLKERVKWVTSLLFEEAGWKS